MTRRRVVTGINAGPLGRGQRWAEPGRFGDGYWEELWAFDGVPARLDDAVDPVDVPRFRLVPAKDRIAVRIITTAAPPTPDDEEWHRRIDFAEVAFDASSPILGMHRTPTIDVIVILSGEVDLVLDGGEEVHLVPGDSVIQRGTMHAWRATGPEPCVAVGFMVPAD